MINILIGMLLGMIISYGIWYLKSEKNIRFPWMGPKKGIFITSLVDKSDETSFKVIYEIEEISRSDKKSKIRILNYHTDKSKYNEPQWKDAVKNFHDNNWVETSQIEWVKFEFESYDPNNPSHVRDKKINQILK